MRAFGLVEVATAAELNRVKKVVNHNAKCEIMIHLALLGYMIVDIMHDKYVENEINDLKKRISVLERQNNEKEAELFEE